MCVWGGGGDGEREVGKGGGEREGELVVYRKVLDFFPELILFHVMGLVLRRINGTEKNTLLLLLLLNRLALLHACDEAQPPYVKAEKIPL